MRNILLLFSFEMDGVIKKIDSRTSDAVALALRFNCPIYTPKILEIWNYFRRS